MKINIYTMAHKKFNETNVEGYIPLHVGKEGKKDIGYIGDNTGDNISTKNPNYCELTGLYWIWKNDKDSDYVGISHYRRYFTLQRIGRNLNKILNVRQIEEIFKKGYDIILPKKEIYKETAYEQYCISSGLSSDWENIKEILTKKYPNYLESYEKVLSQNLMHQFNMMICSKELYNSYCKWLFDILFELEKVTDLTNRNDYQQRIYGFLSERLLNVWILQNNLKVKECRVVNMDMKVKDVLRLNLRRIKNLIIFKKRISKKK